MLLRFFFAAVLEVATRKKIVALPSCQYGSKFSYYICDLHSAARHGATAARRVSCEVGSHAGASQARHRNALTWRGVHENLSGRWCPTSLRPFYQHVLGQLDQRRRNSSGIRDGWALFWVLAPATVPSWRLGQASPVPGRCREVHQLRCAGMQGEKEKKKKACRAGSKH